MAQGNMTASGKSHQALGRDFFSTDEIRALAERSDLWGWWLVLHCWGTIALALGLFALWPNPLTFLLAVIIIGSRQLGLAILMHEAAHNALFRSRGLNDWTGEWLCGRPILADLGERLGHGFSGVGFELHEPSWQSAEGIPVQACCRVESPDYVLHFTRCTGAIPPPLGLCTAHTRRCRVKRQPRS